eukprot:918242_1
MFLKFEVNRIMAPAHHHLQLITIIIVLSCNLMLSTTESDFDILWNDSMESTSTSSWEGNNVYEFGSTSDKCPNTPDPCTSVSSSSTGNSFILRDTDITGYSTFQLQIDVNIYEVDFRDAFYCQIWYQYDDEGWIKYSAYSNLYTNLLIDLPSPSSNTSIGTVLSIQLEITGDTANSEASCYWDNIILRGVKSSASGSDPSTDTDSQLSTVSKVIWLLIVFLCIGTCLGCHCKEDITRWFEKRKEQNNSKQIPKRATIENQFDLSNIANDFDRSLLASWLEHEVQLPQYLSKFLKHGYDNLRAIKMIRTSNQLANIGITKLGHQILILEAIHQVDLSIYTNDNNNGASNHIKVFVEEDETHAHALQMQMRDLENKVRDLEMKLKDKSSVIEIEKMNHEDNNQNARVVILDKGRNPNHSLLVTSEGPSHNPLNMTAMGNIEKHRNEFAQAHNSDCDDFDAMFVDCSENSVSKPQQNKVLHQNTTGRADDQKISFHGTKGNYYDEYNHQIYKKRIIHE